VVHKTHRQLVAGLGLRDIQHCSGQRNRPPRTNPQMTFLIADLLRDRRDGFLAIGAQLLQCRLKPANDKSFSLQARAVGGVGGRSGIELTA